MHPRILSPLEERQIKTYLKADGEKNLNVRVLVTRAHKYFPQIEKDVALVKELLVTYERKKLVRIGRRRPYY
jgi:hypothetical protein